MQQGFQNAHSDKTPDGRETDAMLLTSQVDKTNLSHTVAGRIRRTFPSVEHMGLLKGIVYIILSTLLQGEKASWGVTGINAT
jgi:hypothetical protein